MGYPQPLLWFIFGFFKKHHYNFYNKYMWKNVHQVYGARIRTHNHKTRAPVKCCYVTLWSVLMVPPFTVAYLFVCLFVHVSFSSVCFCSIFALFLSKKFSVFRESFEKVQSFNVFPLSLTKLCYFWIISRGLTIIGWNSFKTDLHWCFWQRCFRRRS